MTRRAPALETIEAFVIATRCRSSREAAEKLALSASAFSRRIQKLESFVGMPLFDRSAAVPALTPVGRQYLAEIEPAIDTIRHATSRVRSIRRRGKLRLMTSQSLATGWLVRRLPEFYAQGGMEIEFLIGRDLDVLRTGGADVAIFGGDLELRGLCADRLLEVQGAVVAARSMVDGRPPPASIEELRHHRLLTVTTPADMWERWFSSAGYPGFPLGQPMRFGTLLLLYEAAASGLGAALAIPIIADPHLREGRLLPCFPLSLPLGTGYSIVYGDEVVRRRADVHHLTTWLREQMRKSEAEFLRHVHGDSACLRAGTAVLDHESRERAARARRVREIVHAS